MATIKVPPVLRPSVGGEKEVAAPARRRRGPARPRRAAPRDPGAAVRPRRRAEPLRQRVPQRRGRPRPRRAGHRRRRVRHAGDPAGDGRRVIREALVGEAAAAGRGLRLAVRAARASSRRGGTADAAARLDRLVDADDAPMLVATVDGEVVGICTVYLDIESVRFGRRAWVEDLAVHPEHRSRGHGKALLDAAKDWARDQGATHLGLDSARRARTRTASTSASSRATGRSASAGSSDSYEPVISGAACAPATPGRRPAW